ncbi:hypothetical protein DXG01_006732 [Tephrocybe rancida]|nr:hypothetical protein DXG01_006732 [Tephrocybe rancida]
MPDPPIPTKAQIDAAFSPALYGMMLGLPLYGIALAQTVFYFRKFPLDSRRWKTVVGVLMLDLSFFDTLLRLSSIQSVRLPSYNQPLGRNSRLVPRRTTFLSIPDCLRPAGGGMGVGHDLAVATSIDSAHSPRTKAFGAVQLVGSVICDVLISISLVFFLNKNRNGVRSIIAILNLVFWQASPQNFNFVIFHYIISKLYINSLLVTLNSRAKFRKRAVVGDAISMNDLRDRPHDPA